MNNHEKPIPISRGKEISTEKLLENLQQKLSMLENLYSAIGKKIKDKELLYNSEIEKSIEKANYGLMSALTNELEKLNKIDDEILDQMLVAQDLIEQGKEKLRDQRQISDLLNHITELEKILNEKDKDK